MSKLIAFQNSSESLDTITGSQVDLFLPQLSPRPKRAQVVKTPLSPSQIFSAKSIIAQRKQRNERFLDNENPRD